MNNKLARSKSPHGPINGVRRVTPDMPVIHESFKVRGMSQERGMKRPIAVASLKNNQLFETPFYAPSEPSMMVFD